MKNFRLENPVGKNARARYEPNICHLNADKLFLLTSNRSFSDANFLAAFPNELSEAGSLRVQGTLILIVVVVFLLGIPMLNNRLTCNRNVIGISALERPTESTERKNSPFTSKCS